MQQNQVEQRDERVIRLLEKHPAALKSPESCQRLLKQLMQRRGCVSGGGSFIRKVAWLGCRLLLVYAFITVSLNCMENTFPKVSGNVRTGRVLSYLNLVYLKSYRWLTVQLGFYRSEFMHGRDREACLVPNPFYSPTVMCCQCQPMSIARLRLNNPKGRNSHRMTLDRHVNPYLVTDSGHQPVTYQELRRTVLNAWDEVSAGSNRMVTHPSGLAPTTLSEMLLSESPPATLMTSWTYGHMSAIRAMRKLVPRPPFIRQDVDYGFARAFYLFGKDAGLSESGQGGNSTIPLGDLRQFQGQAVLLGLHGRVKITLTPKRECCPNIHGNASVVLTPGLALIVPCECQNLHATRQGDEYAMLHLFSLFSSTGIKQPAPITGRVPEMDETED